MKKPVYPDQTLAERCRQAGADVKALWEIRGPKNTGVAWISGLLVNGHVVLVQTFGEGGWASYTSSGRTKPEDDAADVLDRCGFTKKKPPPRPDRFMRLPEVAKATGLQRSTIYELVAAGEFPRQVQIADRAVAWVESEVVAWQQSQIATRGE